MTDGMTAVESVVGSSYDLRPYADQDRRLNVRVARAWWYVGFGFTALGLAITIYLGALFGFVPWISALILVVCGGIGFGPLVLSQVPDRAWRARVELRLDGHGIAIVDSAGHAERVGWDNRAAVVTVREITDHGPSGGAVGAGEWLTLMPGYHTAHIGADAREGLLAACRAHGFVLREDRFEVPNPADRGRTGASAIFRMAALPGPGGAFDSPPQASDRLRSAPSALSGADATFAAPSAQQDLQTGGLAARSNPIAAVTVTREGIHVVLRSRKTVTVEWREPKARLNLFALLPNPISALSDAESWQLTVRRTPVGGTISREAYAAVTASARAAGLVVTTARLPRPDLGKAAAFTEIRRTSLLP